MFQKGLSKPTHANLELLAKLPTMQDFYLAGGTSIALHLGHRLSFDLDFFTTQTFSSEKLAKTIKKYGMFTIEQILEDTLLGKLNGEKVSFFYYRYPLLKPPRTWKGIAIANLSDLAAMKLEAISGRGRKRGFIDLYFISKEISLKQALELYDQKYKALANNITHLLKSLEYFEDANEDEMPQMIEKVSWGKVKEFFTKEAIRLTNQLLTRGRQSKTLINR